MNVLGDGHRIAIDAALRGCRPDPELEIDKWSEEHMVVPRDAAKPGRYRIAHTPMARRILQTLSPRHPARRVVIKGASQMLKTQIALNFLAASAHLAPANMLVLEPTDSLAKRLSARVSKVIRDVAVLGSIFAKPRSRDNRNTVFAKDFEGGTMYIATAGSAANLAELNARYVYVDEVDRVDHSVDGEGDPVLLAENRATTFESNCKFLHTSSPALAGASKIDALFDMGTQEVYLVPCPHCAHHFELVLHNFRYQRDEDTGFMSRAWFVCPDCGGEIDERHKSRMLRDAGEGGTAHWHARGHGDGETVSFHVSAFCAPVGSITWLKLARELARAKERLEQGDPTAMQVFYNTRLALSWENALERTTSQELMARTAVAPRCVPDWALVVTIFVDTQQNRLELQTHAWGPGLEHAVIDYQVLMGSPAVFPEAPGSVWQRLDEYRCTPWPHVSGVLIYASAFGIDSGGSNTQDVYNYGTSRAAHGWHICHGASRPDRPIVSNIPSKVDLDWNGHRVAGGVLLWAIGTDVAKDHLHNRYKLTGGWGAMHFNHGLNLNWFDGLLSERLHLKRKPGGGFRRAWVKTSHAARNEPLDLAVGNLAMAHRLDLHKWSLHDWTRLRQKLIPAHVTPDLFVSAPAPSASPSAAPYVDVIADVIAESGVLSDPLPPDPSDRAEAPPLASSGVATTPLHAQAHPTPSPSPVGRRTLSRGLA